MNTYLDHVRGGCVIAGCVLGFLAAVSNAGNGDGSSQDPRFFDLVAIEPSLEGFVPTAISNDGVIVGWQHCSGKANNHPPYFGVVVRYQPDEDVLQVKRVKNARFFGISDPERDCEPRLIVGQKAIHSSVGQTGPPNVFTPEVWFELNDSLPITQVYSDGLAEELWEDPKQQGALLDVDSYFDEDEDEDEEKFKAMLVGFIGKHVVDHEPDYVDEDTLAVAFELTYTADDLLNRSVDMDELDTEVSKDLTDVYCGGPPHLIDSEKIKVIPGVDVYFGPFDPNDPTPDFTLTGIRYPEDTPGGPLGALLISFHDRIVDSGGSLTMDKDMDKYEVIEIQEDPGHPDEWQTTGVEQNESASRECEKDCTWDDNETLTGFNLLESFSQDVNGAGNVVGLAEFESNLGDIQERQRAFFSESGGSSANQTLLGSPICDSYNNYNFRAWALNDWDPSSNKYDGPIVVGLRSDETHGAVDSLFNEVHWEREAWLWFGPFFGENDTDAARTGIKLAELLNLDQDQTGLHLLNATSVNDSATVVGYARDNTKKIDPNDPHYKPRPWIAILDQVKFVPPTITRSICQYCEDPISCKYDLNGDDYVNGPDIATILSKWGKCNTTRYCDGSCKADLDLNNKVDASDLAMLLAAWGPCPTLPCN